MILDRPQVDAMLDTELYDQDPSSSPLRPLKRVPSFSSRPGFPSGLQVLLVETDRQSRDKVAKQLKQLCYIGTCCASTAEAAALLNDKSREFDIVLAEAKSVAQDAPDFVSLLSGMPLVLMSDGGSATQVWKSIELGAVEYLEKPLSTSKLKNIWQHVVRKMMENNDVEELSKLSSKDSGFVSSLLQQKSSSQPDSPSTPSAFSSGIDQDYTLVDDSLKSFNLEGMSSSSHSDPSDLFLPDITSNTSELSSKPVLTTAASTAHASVDSTPIPASKKLRRTQHSSTATAAASVTHRPPLAIRPAPSGFAMMQQPPMGMGGGQWGGYQNMPGYVWGTPMSGMNTGMDRCCSWQMPPHQASPMFAGEMQRHHSMPVGSNPMTAMYSETSCNAGPTELSHSLSLDLTASNTFLHATPTLGSICLDANSEFQVAKAPPIGLRLKKSESFLDLINEHLKRAESAAMSG